MAFDELFPTHLGGIQNNCSSKILESNNPETNELYIFRLIMMLIRVVTLLGKTMILLVSYVQIYNHYILNLVNQYFL